MEPLELSEELSASFYAAATAVSHFKKQCLLEEKRQEAHGTRTMCEVIAQHIKMKFDGVSVQTSVLLKFLHLQTAALMLKENRATQAASLGAAAMAETAETAAGDNQVRRFQSAAGSLAQMYTHARHQSISRSSGAARHLCQHLVQCIAAYDGQMLEKTALLDFLQRYYEEQQQQQQEKGEAVHAPFVSNATVTSFKENNGCRKRSHEELDPAFEQAFKRQCQPPPTPPSAKAHSRHSIIGNVLQQ